MTMRSWTGRSLLLRLGGAALLLGAGRLALWLTVLERGHAGQEPAAAYALCLLTFVCASGGAALLANGARLFGKVPVGQLWASRPDDDGQAGGGA
ncbi:MAG TPA: hypothetical protein VGC10_05545 [Sphingomonas sp.]